jgi:hypothetical protein
MPVLLLATGDPHARALLKKAIEARYGVLPPAIAALMLGFSGRARARFGPITAWVPLEARAWLQFPVGLRWDFALKPFGVPIRRGGEAFDGQTYRVQRGGRIHEITADAAARAQAEEHLRARLWAVAALLLTPLGEEAVRLEGVPDDERAFTARAGDGPPITVRLRADHSIAAVEVLCYNPEAGARQRFTLLPATEFVEMGVLRLPARLEARWDDAPSFEVALTTAENLVSIPPGVFALADAG